MIAASHGSRDNPERIKTKAATSVATDMIASNLASVPEATRDSEDTFFPVLKDSEIPYTDFDILNWNYLKNK